MKFKDNPAPVDTTLPRPKPPIGYMVFHAKSREFFARHTKLTELREDCIRHKLEPIDVKVFRLYGDGKEEDRKVLFLHEYAFKAQRTERIGGVLLVNEAWVWQPPVGHGVTAQMGDHGVEFVVNGPTKWDAIKRWWKGLFS